MPKEFEEFGEKRVDRDYDSRKYFARAFRYMPTYEEGEDNIYGDSEDMDVYDYEFDATSFPDALGQWIAHEVQVAVGNGVLVFARFVQKLLIDVIDKDDEGHDMLMKFIPKPLDEHFEEMCEAAIEAETPEAVAIPIAFINELINRTLAITDQHNNYWFHQEPQVVMFGNPQIIEGMKVVGSTTEDIAEDGITEMEKYLRSKLEEE